MKRVMKAAALITTLAVLIAAFCACNMLKVKDSPTRPGSEGDGTQGSPVPAGGDSSSQITLSFDVAGGSAVPAITLAAGATLSAPADPVREGYTFAGWFRGDSATAYKFTTMPEVNLTLTAHWTANSYTISFAVAGGTPVPDAEVEYGKRFSLGVSSRTGYVFAGWKTEAGLALTSASGEGLSRWNIASDVELQAIWNPVRHSITYADLYDASNPNPSSYTIDTETITLQDPGPRLHYDFAGWRLPDGTPITEIPQGGTENLEISAEWALHDYVITYENLRGAENSNPGTYNMGSPGMDLVAPADRPGNTFLGWFDAPSDGNRVTEIKPERYRGVWFNGYRPYRCTSDSSASNSYQDENGYNPSTVYWFRYEPIKWRILNESGGKALILCETAIDALQYDYDGAEERNDYKESTIRKWLNDTFYDTAFSSLQKALIQTTLVDNGVSGTGYDSNPYACGNTNDKIFLLSYMEATNAAYGLDTSAARMKASTEYAQSQGCLQSTDDSCQGNCYWWLRSPDHDRDSQVRRIHYDGAAGSTYAYIAYCGVVPALTISLSDSTVYTRIDADGNPDESGEYILFGEYPQTRVTADATLSVLGDFDSNLWASYGHYVSGAVSDFMKYSDKRRYPDIGDRTLYAGWNLIDYAITYEGVSGTEHDNPSGYTVETETITLRDPSSRTGYDFLGWYDSESGGTRVTEIPLGSTGDLTLYARWNLIDYAITYENLHGVEHDNPPEYNAEDADITLVDPEERPGYDFSGWYDSETGGRKVTEIKPEKYRGVYFTSYRSEVSGGGSSADYSYQDDNGYNTSTVYWFRYEPIKWRILNESGGKALILCDMAIDSQQWDYKGGSNHKNNYARSTIRAWLNGTFLDTAFSAEQKALIQTTTVDNSAGGDYACGNTDDKIFILSVAEASNAAYGLDTPAARQKKSTDYAKAQGCRTYPDGNCRWWLRSPFGGNAYAARLVNPAGDFSHYSVADSDFGVVPALRISLSNTSAYTRINANGMPSATGKYILFGEYPQTKVTDSATLSELGNHASNTWTSYRYYVSGAVSDFMKYSDKRRYADIGDKTLYARWTPIEYSITYKDLHGASNSNPIRYTIESEKITLQNPGDRVGYTFSGWSDSPSEGNVVSEIPQGSIGNLEIHAIWTPVEYTLTYENLQGSEQSNPGDYNIESADIVLTAPTDRTGYTFTGWYTGKTGGNKVTKVAHGSYGDRILYARWSIVNYSVTYKNLSGATHSNPATYTVETETITFQNPSSRSGYDFAGWQLADGTAITEIPLGSTGNLEIHAIWIPTEYAITYENLHGVEHANPPEYNVEDNDITLVDPEERPGYDFSGWYDSETGGNKVTEIIPGKFVARHRGVYFTQYRPLNCSDPSSADKSRQDDNGYNLSTVYWFKYEPIKWRILNEADGKALILCEMAIDSQQWDYKGGSNYKNNYAESTIRKWLNDTFYNTAFSSLQKTLIQTTLVDNSVASTGYSSNDYVCANTNDKIFLLSYKEATNAAYGLGTNAARLKRSTDYAQSQGCGLSDGNCYWWLRSPVNNNTDAARDIYCDGTVNSNYVYRCHFVAVPALTISLSNPSAYQRVNADGNPSATGKYILFGEYPQTKVTDSATLSELGNYASNEWTSYGYYVSGAVSDFMKYSDKGNHADVGDKTLYARWTPVEYSITYKDLHEASNSNPVRYTIESEKITLQNPGDRAGYTFSGWQLADGSAITEIPQGSTGNLEIHAVWTPIEYTLTYENLQGSTHSNPGNYNIESADIVLTAPTDRTGYTFTGWYDAASGSEAPGDASKYRGVYFTGYRPKFCGDPSSADKTYQDENGYSPSTVYWFKYEPIKWRILNESGGNALILCETAIDSQQFDYRADKTYKNNYKESTIRKWLNDTFYNTAFSSLQKELIQITTVDNSVSSTGFDPNQYACEDTNDKIFLLSYKEAKNAAYGLDTAAARQKKSTDYAKAQGCWQSTSSSYLGNCQWLLRSPGNDWSDTCWSGYSDGTVPKTYVYHTSRGIVPALTVSLSNPSAYTRVNADGTPDATGEYILFGEYPQTRVTDDATLSVLGDFDSNNWTSYGYYVSGAVSDFMKYAEKGGHTEAGNKVTKIPQGSVGDKTLYARWTPIEYNVTYVLNGGTNNSANPSVYTIETETITLQAPSRPGYDFAGWSDAPSEGNAVSEIPQGTIGDKTLYARWTPIVYTVIYENAGSAENPNPATYTCESEAIVLTDLPADPGYAFGWFDSETGGTEVTEIPQGSIGDRTLYARWELIEYTIAYNTLEGASNPNPDKYTIETETISLQNPGDRAGYDFSGWFNTSSASRYRGVYFTQYRPYWCSNPSSAVNSNQEDNGYTASTVYWFKYEPIKWRILSEEDGIALLLCETAIDSQQWDWDGIEGKNNYAESTIRAWLNETFYNTAFNELQKELIQTTEVDNSVSSTGYDSNSNVCADTNDKIFLLSYKEATNAAYGLDTAAARQKKSTDYAKSQGCSQNPDSNHLGNCFWWFRSPYNDDGDSARMQIYNEDDYHDYDHVYVTNLGVVPALTISLSDSTAYTRVNADGTPDASGEYILFGEYPQTKVTDSATLSELGDFDSNDWTSYGYYISGSVSDFMKYAEKGGQITEIPHGSTGDVTLYARWNLIDYTITYENVGEVSNPNPVTYTCESDTIVLTDLPADPGYAFGWFDAETGGNKIIKIAQGTIGNKTLYARWKPIEYTIAYNNLHSGTNSNPATYTIETETITLQNPGDAPGYNFVEWQLADGTVITEIPQGSTGDLEIHAMWNLIDYTITYKNLQGSTHSNPDKYTVETEKTLQNPTNRIGYTFDGWFDAETGGNRVTTIPHGSYGDKTLYARWTPIEYNVTYVLNGGINDPDNPSKYTIENLESAEGTIPLKDPQKRKKETGNYLGNGLYELTTTTYIFNGWYKDNSFTTPVTALSLSLGTVTLYAKWTASTSTASNKNYLRINADGTANSSGEYILFGEYPQTKVTDSALLSALGNYSSNTWKSYGYYISGSVNSFMKYTDKEYNGSRYRGVYFTQYRPYYCTYDSSADNSFQDDNGYNLSTVYWFKYEPIKWRILSEEDGIALLLCETAIDSQQWDWDGIEGKNNYAESTIRAWLNDTFYNTAFNDLQKELIQTTEVDNSVSSTGYETNPNVCANTNDKIFLLSYRGAANAAYNLDVRYAATQKKRTDYAKSQGCHAYTDSNYPDNCWWWLRSPVDYDGDAREVWNDGHLTAGLYEASASVYDASCGVVPALKISL